MEGVPLGPIPEAGFEELDDIKEKKYRRSQRHSPEVIGAAATHSAERSVAPDAHQLHGVHIGNMLVAAESAKTLEIPIDKHVETLNHAELLAYSQRVIVDGTSLRQIYETHLIGERGLRRLVSEYLRAGDLEEALRREIVERAIDFERDPAMRDLAVPFDPAGGDPASQATTALDQLLERAAAKVPAANVSEETAFYRARANYEASQRYQHRHHRKLVDVALAAIIGLLVIIVITLYLMRR